MIQYRNQKPPTPEAEKAIEQLVSELGAQETDRRSAISKIMAAAIVKHAGVLISKKILNAMRQEFVDWNEVRISDDREVISVLTAAGAEKASYLRGELHRILTDIYEQYNQTNFEWEVLDETVHCKPVTVEGQEPPPEVATIRDEGLPKHPVHAGFLDGKRLLTETTQLEAKLVHSKNSDFVFSVVFDNPEHSTSAVVWAVALKYKLVPEGLDPSQAIPALRDALGREGINFVRLALAYYEKNSRSIERFFKQQKPMPVDEGAEVPFSVQIGFVNPEDVRRNEPLMPRSDGIGRVSKRAMPRARAPLAEGESARQVVVSSASGRRPRAESSVSAKLPAVEKTASARSSRRTEIEAE